MTSCQYLGNLVLRLAGVSRWTVGLHSVSVSPSNQHDLRAANILAVFALVYLEATFFLHQEEPMPPHTSCGHCCGRVGESFEVGRWLELV